MKAIENLLKEGTYKIMGTKKLKSWEMGVVISNVKDLSRFSAPLPKQDPRGCLDVPRRGVIWFKE